MIVFLYKSPVYAHPGIEGPDGCHYCWSWTRCEFWGNTPNTRHGHRGQLCDPSKGPEDPEYLKRVAFGKTKWFFPYISPPKIKPIEAIQSPSDSPMKQIIDSDGFQSMSDTEKSENNLQSYIDWIKLVYGLLKDILSF